MHSPEKSSCGRLSTEGGESPPRKGEGELSELKEPQLTVTGEDHGTGSEIKGGRAIDASRDHGSRIG